MGITVAELTAQIKAEGASGAVNEINGVGEAGDKANKSLVEGNDRSSRSFARMVKNAAGIAASLFLIKKAADTLGDAVKVTANFETSISNLSAITGAVGDDLKFLTDKSLEFGQSTTLSASQAAEAFKLVASAKPDLLDSAEALSEVTKETIVLAEAAGTTLPEAAITLGSALNQFGAEADQAGRFINVLAAGAKFGASEIADTAAALADSGTVAASANIKFEELNAAIQSLSTVSIKGGKAGTNLRNIILKLQKEGVDKLNPAVVGLSASLQNLNDENRSTTELMDLFGLESITAASALLKQADSLEELTGKLTGTNIAYEQARINNDNLAGDVKRLASAYEALQIQIGTKNTPGMRLLVQTMTDVIKVFGDTNVVVGDSEGAFETLSKAIISISEFTQKLTIEFLDLIDLTITYKNILGTVLGGRLDLASDIIEARKEQRKAVDEEIESLAKRSREITENVEKNSALIESETKLAETIAKTNAERDKPPETGLGGAANDEDFDDEGLQKKIEALRNALLTEKELVQESFLDRKLIIESAYDDEILKFGERSELLLEIENQRDEKIAELDEKKLARDQAAEEKENERALRGLENIENSLLTELERLEETLEIKEFMIEDAFQRGLISAERRTDLLLKVEEQFQKSRVSLEEKASTSINNLRLSVAKQAISLAKNIFGNSKELATASILLTKGVAIAQTLAHSQTAAVLAYASQLVPGDPTSIIRAEAARSSALALGVISAGLIGATGFAEIADLGNDIDTDLGDDSSGGDSGTGIANLVPSGVGGDVDSEDGRVTTVIINNYGNVVAEDLGTTVAKALEEADGVDRVNLIIESTGERVQVRALT